MTNNIPEFSNLIQFQEFQFKNCPKQITDFFIASLQKNDIFSCHCLDFVKYLNFKRCDKRFREAFFKFLLENNIKYIVSNQPLTQNILNNFFNAEKIFYAELDQKMNRGARTNRDFYEWLAKESGKTFEEIARHSIYNKRNIFGTLEIKADKQNLNGSLNGGCWLTLWKHK
jgi:hypothetical protein